MIFKEYQHIEKLGNDECYGIEIGECYVFPKIDGTCGSIWKSDEGEIMCGSRHRELSLEKDNAGFYKNTIENKKIKLFFDEYPNMMLYGEWLVPHTLKTYKETAWRNFYIFDVTDENGNYLHYNQYKLMLEKYDIEYIPCIAIITDGSKEQFINCLEYNNYLISDNAGIGEGIIIKNYSFKNNYGRTIWAKIVTSEFKEKHVKTMGAPEIIGELTIERRIINDYLSKEYIQKEYSKISIEGWNSKMIPKLLGIIWYEFIKEYSWEIIKKYNNPTIDYKKLNKICIEKIKLGMKELF